MGCADRFLQAVNAMKRFANFRDIDVISKAVSILPHPEAKVRQVKLPISATNSFKAYHFHTFSGAHASTHASARAENHSLGTALFAQPAVWCPCTCAGCSHNSQQLH
jgi:hypothetical protein